MGSMTVDLTAEKAAEYRVRVDRFLNALVVKGVDGSQVAFQLDSEAEVGKLVAAICNAFERATGQYMVMCVCSWCNKYLGIGVAALQGVSHGMCPDCLEKEKRKAGMDDGHGTVATEGDEGPHDTAGHDYREDILPGYNAKNGR